MKIILLSLICAFSTVVGAVILFFNDKYRQKILAFSFGLAASVMFLISVFELIGEGISYVYGKLNILTIFVLGLAFLCLGACSVQFLERKKSFDNKLYNIGFLCMLSVLSHNIPEGIITALSLSSNYSFGIKMFLVILIHNIPEGISIAAPVYYGGKSKIKALQMCIISGGGEVIGALLGILMFRFVNINFLMFGLLMITSGIMIYLSLFKLLLEGMNSGDDNYFISGLLIGLIIVLITI